VLAVLLVRRLAHSAGADVPLRLLLRLPARPVSPPALADDGDAEETVAPRPERSPTCCRQHRVTAGPANPSTSC